MKTAKTILEVLDILTVEYKLSAPNLAYEVIAKIDSLLGYKLPSDIEEKIRALQSRLANAHCCPKDACAAMDEFLELAINPYEYEEKGDGVVYRDGVGYKKAGPLEP